jgi:thioredoxin-dependent peroxiredoxin
VAQAYGAAKMVGIARMTFLIGPDGNIRKIWPQVKPAGHADEVLEALGGQRTAKG